jgi:uncharacterized protein YdcH (DUF465 family)
MGSNFGQQSVLTIKGITMEIILNELRVQIESLRLDDMKLDVKINKLDDRIKRLEQVMNNLAILLSEVQHGKMGN